MPKDAEPTRRVWITWEVQRRNVELASAFSCIYLCFDLPGVSGIRRYFLASWRTLGAILRERPAVVFAQSPSLVLTLLLAAVKDFLKFRFIIDAHNAALDYTEDRRVFVRGLAKFALRRADFVIVSNSALAARAERLGARPLVLPDRLPEIPDLPPPEWVSDLRRPLVTLISTFAFDEPIELFIDAYKRARLSGSLCITGRRAKAGALVREESEAIRFTDFLPPREYEALIRHSDLLVDLTTQKDCLVCGAYEAVSVGVPILLSDCPVVRENFPEGCLYAENTAEAYITALQAFLANTDGYWSGMQRTRRWFPGWWQSWYAQASSCIQSIE